MDDTGKTKKETDLKRKITFSRIKRKILKHVWLVRTALILMAGLFIYLFVIGAKYVYNNTPIKTYFTLAGDFILTPSSKISSYNNRVNILVLGKGGQGHTAPDLTDTMMVYSVSLQESSIVDVSIPRDIWIPEIRAKINSAYYWGRQKQESGGIVMAKSTVEEVVGQPINYALVIDFSGFKKIIDVLGGVQVNVENSFVDEKYPIEGRENDECGGDPEYKCRYETVSFQAGEQIMDGETALKFARSRNAQGDEGTDIAREARQQKIISALKKKILSPKILLSPRKVFAISSAVKEFVETDIDPSAASILARRVLESRNSMNSYLIPDELIINPPISARFDNLYVFIPAAGSGNWEEINKWFTSILY